MFAAIYLPNFALQAALRHHPELRQKAVALIDDEQSKATIMQLTESAGAAGISKGMTPTQALARCLTLIVKSRVPEQEKTIGEILLHYAYTLSPYIEGTAPGICTIQFTSDKNLIEKLSQVIEQLEQLQLIAQAGIAATPDLSCLAAHLARPVLQIDEAKTFLAPLPIETLSQCIPRSKQRRWQRQLRY